MSRFRDFRDDLNTYLSLPGALCMVAAGWLYLAANHVDSEARRVSQAYVLDSLSGARSCQSYWRTVGQTQHHGARHVAGNRSEQQGVILWCVLVFRADARKLERLLPMLVALRGRVESNDPKKCELSDRKAVIHEVSSCLQIQYRRSGAGAVCGGGV